MGKSLQPDADQLHSVVGFDQDASEVRRVGDAFDADRLQTEVVFQSLSQLPSIAGANAAANRSEELLHPLQALRCGIDRDADQ